MHRACLLVVILSAGDGARLKHIHHLAAQLVVCRAGACLLMQQVWCHVVYCVLLPLLLMMMMVMVIMVIMVIVTMTYALP